jgi:acetyl esterase/lipase
MRSLLISAMLLALPPAFGAESDGQASAREASQQDALRASIPKRLGPFPLYEGEIPNSKPAPDQESRTRWLDMELISKVSHPTYSVYLPAASRASGAAVLVFPGGAYQVLSWDMEGQWIATALQDHGIAAILVKYRLPSDETMVDKSIAPLQDAQQALRQVRHNASRWGIDPQKVGAMGFSAGGHLAATLGTLFDTPLVPNPDRVSMRPDFLILVYPVISMAEGRVPAPVWSSLLGEHPPADQVRRFSSALQVTQRTPPSLLLATSNDDALDPDHTIEFYRALHQQGVPAELVIFERGLHGFFELTRDEWMSPMWAWLSRNGWLKR